MKDEKRFKSELIEELGRASQEWQKTFDASNDAIFVLDKDQHILRANKKAEQLFQRPFSELIGRYCWEIVHKTTGPFPGCPCVRAKDSLLRETMDLQVGQSWLQVTVDPIIDATGGFDGAVHLVNDITERKRAEERLRQSENDYRDLFHNATDAIYIQDKEGRFLDVNQGAVDMYGYPREFFLGKTPEFLSAPGKNDMKKILGFVADALDGKPQQYDFWGIRKNGEIFPKIVRSQQGSYLGQKVIVTFALDITERKRGESRLEHLSLVLRAVRNVNQLITQEKDRDRLLRGVCEILTEDRGCFNAWIALLNEEKKATAVFESGLGASFGPMAEQLKRGELTHCSKETLGQKEVIAVEDPTAECSDCPLAVQYTGRGGLSARLEHEGVVFGILTVSIPAEFTRDEEELSLFREVADDIAFALHNLKTEKQHKKTEDELRGSEERYRTLFQFAPDAYYLNDLKGTFVAGNRAAERITGYSTTELVGSSFLKLGILSVRQIPKAAALLLKSGLGLPTGPDEFVLNRKDGTKITVEISTVPVEMQGRKIVLGLARDVTDRMLAEKEKTALEEQLLQAQKMESVGRLAGGVAHDFNNLLTIILSSCSLMTSELREGDPLLDDVRHIDDAGKRAVSLTRQLLAFSRRQMLQTKVIDLNLILDDLDKMLRRLIGEDIDIETDLDPDIWKVEADPGQIEQIVLNLAVNARDAMPGVGKLTIETANVELDEEYGRNHVDVMPGSYVMLAVSDTGSGMDSETTAQIFEPFFSTKDKDKGTGLGLSTVYGIVKQHGGNIWVYSEPGKGTIFKIYLPRSTATKKTAARTPTPVTDSHGTETVLVVEDEAAVLKLAVRMLERKGYNVLAARDGLEGQGVANTHEGPIHLLLTDVVMPRMGGKELAQKLLTTRPELKVLYMSGYTDNAIVHHGVLEKGTHFLQKPFSGDSLPQKVREVIDYRKDSSK